MPFDIMNQRQSLSSTTHLLNGAMSVRTSLSDSEYDVDDCSMRTGSIMNPPSLQKSQPMPCAGTGRRPSRPLPGIPISENPSRSNLVNNASTGNFNGRQLLPFEHNASTVTHIENSPPRDTSTPARSQVLNPRQSIVIEEAEPLRDPERGAPEDRRKQVSYPSKGHEGSLMQRFVHRCESIYGRMRDRTYGRSHRGYPLPSNTSSNTSNHYCHFSMSLISLLLVIALGTFVFFIYIGTIKLGGDNATDQSSLCVPREALVEHLNPTSYDFKEDIQGLTRQICAQSPSAKAKLLQLVITQLVTLKNERPQASRLIGGATPHKEIGYQASKEQPQTAPFAHLALGNTERDTDSLNTYPISLYDSSNHNNQNGRLYFDVKVSRFGIEIIKSGLYYVYSSAYFDSKKDHVSHYVRAKEKNNVPRVLLKSMSHQSQTHFIGGAFCLRQGTIISASVDQRDVVRSDKMSSYLGLYMISQDSPNQCFFS